ncbi:la-related protein 1A isoform X2 [Cucumis melo var. makuwa]|uniref:La-related protein 1A isoform X2 n=1 Tax=Cucumis melo var. makuwa TaxID=1194695 RepID=A0A5D3BEU8_CUCMM|nr:la-related protein 1A isoform X2 [Cucumis melo var. makuwa]
MLNIETSSNPVDESTNSLVDENASDGSRVLASNDNIKSSLLQGCSWEQFSSRDNQEVANLDIVKGDSLIVQLDDGVKKYCYEFSTKRGGIKISSKVGAHDVDDLSSQFSSTFMLDEELEIKQKSIKKDDLTSNGRYIVILAFGFARIHWSSEAIFAAID